VAIQNVDEMSTTQSLLDSSQAVISNEQIAKWRSTQGQEMTSAMGEYVPEEFWILLAELERLRAALAALK
jgi:hypothetical protein